MENSKNKILFICSTSKSLLEALPFAEHKENMLCTKIVLNVRNNFCTQHVLPRFELGIFMYWNCNSMNNLSSYCGSVDAKIRAPDKDLPVHTTWTLMEFWNEAPLTTKCFTIMNTRILTGNHKEIKVFPIQYIIWKFGFKFKMKNEMIYWAQKLTRNKFH